MVAFLLVLQAILLVDVARRTGCTTDEHHYFNSGRILTRHGYAHWATMLQGPLPLRANQLFVDQFPPNGFESSAPQAEELLFRGRLPTLLFVLPATWLVYAWSRRLFGDAGGLFSLVFLSLHPLWLAYGGLLLVDAQHASLLMLTLFLLARHLERPSSGRLAAFAAAGAVAVTTKYLALLALGPAGLLALGASLRAAPAGRRLRAGLLAALCLAGVGLGVLQVGYRIGASAHTPRTEYRSAGLRAAQALPVLRHGLALLPSPLVEGIDYQREQSEATWRVFLEGDTCDGSVLYYPLVFFRRTPELLLLLLIPAWALARRARHRGDLVALGVPLAVMLAYLSLENMQLGVRYALILVPAACLVLGALGTWRGFAQRTWLAPLAAAGCALVLALDLVRNGPDWLGYFNTSSGGQAHAYRYFRDTNCDFGQHEARVDEWLASFAPHPVTVLGARSGGRFGRVAVRPSWLGRRLEGSMPALEWAMTGEPVGHLGAAWYVFDLTREAFEASLAREESVPRRRALAIALLAEGERQEARRVAEPLRLASEDPLRRLLAARALVPEVERSLWRSLGREDLSGRPPALVASIPKGDGPLLRLAQDRAQDRAHYLSLLKE